MSIKIDYKVIIRFLLSVIVNAMQFLYNNDLINQIVDKLFRHRRNDYSDFHLENILANMNVIHQILPVYNHNYEKLCVSLFQTTPQSEICIVFMHGYGSNRLECCNILKVLKEPYSLCSFDFSGSGKSEGDRVTYGIKQKQDIRTIFDNEEIAGYKKFILWGRSMGATSALLYCIKYKPIDVLLQIVDSPFYSFEMIAFQIANKNVKAPQFVISFALQMAKKNCGKFENNPFNIKLQNVGECTVPALFVYCEADNVINYQNSQKICEAYRATFEKLVIEQNHNMVRTQQTISKIFSFIHKYCKKNSAQTTQKEDKGRIQEGRGKLSNLRSSITSQNQKTREKSGRKGIERVVKEQFSKRYDDYGIWVASKPKFHTPFNPQTPQAPKHCLQRFKPHTAKRLHLSLSSSFTVKQQKSEKTHQFSTSPSVMTKGIEREQSMISNYGFQRTEGEQPKPKLSSVRSLGGSRYLNNSKYL